MKIIALTLALLSASFLIKKTYNWFQLRKTMKVNNYPHNLIKIDFKERKKIA